MSIKILQNVLIAPGWQDIPITDLLQSSMSIEEFQSAIENCDFDILLQPVEQDVSSVVKKNEPRLDKISFKEEEKQLSKIVSACEELMEIEAAIKNHQNCLDILEKLKEEKSEEVKNGNVNLMWL